MTLPDERYRALAQVPAVLTELARRPGPVSKSELKRVVSSLLRHYPTEGELKRIALKVPGILDIRPYMPKNDVRAGHGRTCLECGWVAFGVTREFAEASVRQFNKAFDSWDEATRETYGNRRSTVSDYECCFYCGGPHTSFRDAAEGDAPPGVTMNPIIVEDDE